jgi:prepilin-type N-terminal cleavage/methylation domain-containing protein
MKIDACHSRRGFSAIEIITVLTVMATLSSMAIPSLLTAMRRGKVNDAAGAIVQVAAQARNLARRHYDPLLIGASAAYYGVVIVNNPGGYVALTYDGAILDAGTPAKPVMKLPLPPSVEVTDGIAADPPKLINGSPNSEWMYSYRTGYPIKVPLPTAPAVSILTLGVRTLDNRIKSALGIYKVGLVLVQD